VIKTSKTFTAEIAEFAEKRFFNDRLCDLGVLGGTNP